ncbi:MAG: hypothetical protein JWN45_2598 [Acidobacteriaceae bacterium]|nr:hypothetical protein [Acidobacteriaceae bacterium]
MSIVKRFFLAVSFFILSSTLVPLSLAQQIDPALFSDMKWRLVGPFRGGRSLSAVGVPGNSSTFYFGAVGGGVWKSTDAGTTWSPIFDSQPVASIGAVEVAPSDPNVIYVGSGEADMRDDITYGNGVYKSTDAGQTWSNIGLRDSRQIGRVIINPKNPDEVFVAALGHAYGVNAERGVFHTTDGGKNWKRVLFKDDSTGAIDLAFDPNDPKVIYASLWQTRRPPWNVYPASNGPGSGLYKSTDSGVTWQQLKSGLPEEGLGRIGIAISPNDHNRIYLIVDAKEGGLYRSDDAGKTFTRTNNEQRIWGRGWYFGGITADPKNADVLYVSNTSVYKSTDGGKSFAAFKGAPGGDDYHSVWISPDDSARMIVSSDQGTIVTLNGGKTWSSWYNQPTGQFYHVATDNRFPYWIYGAQQDSGAMAVPSRSNSASISERDWHPVEVGGESGMIATNPADPNVVYGGTVTSYDFTTAQSQNISPTTGRAGSFRTIWTLPLAISSADTSKLYFAHQMLFRTIDAGKHWDVISPDLTREDPGVPANLDAITAKYGLASPRKGVIYSIAPSPLDAALIWVGTDDGLIQVTHDDGKHWQNVTPEKLTPWSKVGTIEASKQDKQSAYAAVDRHRLEDLRPYIYRTHDGGKSWQLISKGIPEGAYVNVVREDKERRGLLYAGTELGLYVSFNDGDDWQPLQLNLPLASIRDISVRKDDLVVATHGRAFWVLDDIGPLREVNSKVASEDAHLFTPQTALRIRPGSDQGTPYPPEIPKGENPPSGSIIDYYLKDAASSPITLEILDSAGGLVRKYSSSEKPPVVDEKTLDIPMYWVRPAQILSGKAGMHRFIWDVHHGASSPGGTRGGGRRGNSGPWAVPGQYTARLTVNGKTYTQPFSVELDPRLKVSTEDLQLQLAASQKAAAAQAQVSRASAQAASVTKQIKDLQAKSKPGALTTTALEQFSQRVSDVAGRGTDAFGGPVETVDTDQTSLRHLGTAFGQINSAVQSAAAAPTPDQLQALEENTKTLQSTLAEWQKVLTQELPQVNAQLRQANLTEINVAVPGGPAQGERSSE